MTQRQVGHYRLDNLLGSGETGEVYQAYDTNRGRHVALKLLREAVSGDPEYLKRFQRELLVAARLREPHVIPVHDFGEIGRQLFIDTGLVNGPDIGAMLAAGHRITPHRAVYLIGQVAEALDAAHAAGLVHRGIKPSNILVASDDFVYVVDFGIARSIGGQPGALTITGATTGTLHYMAPERFAGHDVDGRADVYSLACVLHECLTGAPPFTGSDLSALMYAQLHSAPPPASSLVEGLPPALDTVIARGMAKDPKDRFATAGAMAAAARHALLTETPAPPPSAIERPAPARAETPAPPPAETPAPPPAKTTAPPLAQTTAQAMSETTEPAVTETTEPAVSETTEPAVTETTEPAVSETTAPALTEITEPAQPAVPVFTARRGVGHPAGALAALGSTRYATGVRDSPTQTVTAVTDHDWGSVRPPDTMPQYLSPDPGDGFPPPGGTARRSRGGWLMAALALLLVAGAAAGVTAGFTRGHNPPAAAGAHGTPTAPGSATAAVALPTVAGTIPVGQNPSYIQVAPNGKFAYVANPGAGAIHVLNTATDRVSGTIKITQGPPQSVSFSPDSRTAYVSVYTTNGAVHLIAFVDTATSTVMSTVQADNVSPGPSTTSPDGRFLYVPNRNTALSGAHENAVDVIDTVSRKLIDHIAVPANPHWVAYGKGGRLYVTDHMSAKVSVVNAATGSIIREIEVGETPHSEALSPSGRRLAVTSFDGNLVFLINTVTDQMIKQIPVGRNPADIAYSRDGNFLYTVNNEDNTVTVIDTAGYRVVGTVATGKAPTSIAILPTGRQAYVTDENDGTIEVLNLPR